MRLSFCDCCHFNEPTWTEPVIEYDRTLDVGSHSLSISMTRGTPGPWVSSQASRISSLFRPRGTNANPGWGLSQRRTRCRQTWSGTRSPNRSNMAAQAFERSRCMIQGIAVIPKHRRDGLGLKIKRYCDLWAAQHDACLVLSIPTNDAARHMNEKVGYDVLPPQVALCIEVTDDDNAITCCFPIDGVVPDARWAFHIVAQPKWMPLAVGQGTVKGTGAHDDGGGRGQRTVQSPSGALPGMGRRAGGTRPGCGVRASDGTGVMDRKASRSSGRRSARIHRSSMSTVPIRCRGEGWSSTRHAAGPSSD